MITTIKPNGDVLLRLMTIRLTDGAELQLDRNRDRTQLELRYSDDRPMNDDYSSVRKYTETSAALNDIADIAWRIHHIECRKSCEQY